MNRLTSLRAITGSALDRVIKCPGSESLPRVDRESEWAAQGTSRHLFLEHVGQIGTAEALKLVPEEHRSICEAIDLEGLPINLSGEVTFAWDYVTGIARELGRGLGRNYSGATETEIVGTIDVFGIAPDSLYIGDYKGFALVDARDNPQLLFSAMCAAKIYAREVVTVEIINLRNGSNWRSRDTVDTFDLLAFESTLKSAIATVLEARDIYPDRHESYLNEGDHCQYCPAFTSCSIKTSMIRQMVEVPAMEPITSANASEAYAKLQIMKDLTNRVSAAVYAFASEQPIDIGDGKVLGLREKAGTEKLNGDIAFEVIEDKLGREAADAAVTRNVTKAGITKAIKIGKTDGTIKSWTETILGAVRDRGGSVRNPTKKVEVYRPKPSELES